MTPFHSILHSANYKKVNLRIKTTASPTASRNYVRYIARTQSMS